MNWYKQGRRKEYRVKDDFKSQGFHVTRSAASQGKFDLIAINQITKEIKLIQCKPDSWNDKKRDRLLEDIIEYNGTYSVEVLVI